MLRSRALAALLGVLLPLSASAGAGDPPMPRRILFVGNSLTRVNDLPGMVAALSRQAGDERPFEVETVAFPGHGLEDHWGRPEARAAIARGGWEFVVLQQGPSSRPENRASLRAWTRRFAVSIRAAGATPALYMVWPSAERSADFAGVSAAYRGAAEAVDGVLLPAGDAWRAAWKADPELELYGEDGLHPSLAGTYLAAIVTYAALSGRDPVGLPGRLELEWGTVEVPERLAALLQRAAREALAGR